MNTIVLDTNIIFSSLVNKNSFLSDILLDKKYNFVMPKYAYIELFKHKEKIMEFTRLRDDEILELLYRLLKNINVFDEDLITLNSLKTAYELVKDIDEDDIIFVALTIEVNGVLWTRDKKLSTKLIEKGFNKFFDHSDFSGNRSE